VLTEAIEQARRHADEVAECRAEVERARVSFMRTRPAPGELRAVARRAITVFSEAGTDAHLADAWQLMGIAELAARDRGAQLKALQQGRRHAIASGDVRRQIDAWNEVGGSMLFGRTPIEEMLVFMHEELSWAREHGLPAVEADALLGGPYLFARLGRFEEAREQLERSKAICRELGIAYGLAEAHMAGAELEMLARDPQAAERELREAIRIAEDMGASRYTAFYRTRIAHVLLAQGRDDDALAELELAREVYGDSELWLTAKARVLARQGRADEAARVAQSAVAAMGDEDNLTARAEAHTALAEVLHAAGDHAGAAEALSEAIALHEEKGNALSAARCRELLEAIAA
jgi:tetratricopeptide (TPR) repeat protein